MPYFVYEIAPPKQLTVIDSFENYRDAKTHARSLRAAMKPGDDKIIKLIFAKSSEEARRLLMEVREPRPMGEE